MDLKEYFRDTDAGPPVERERLYRANADWQWRRLMYLSEADHRDGQWLVLRRRVPGCCSAAIWRSPTKKPIFGLSEINWGIIPAGIVTKSVAMAMAQRNALYYIMTGDTFDGKRAAEIGLVNFAVPKAELKDRTRALAKKLMEKNPFVHARGQDGLSPRPSHVVGVVARIADGEVRPDQVPRSGKGRPQGHVAISRRQDLSAGSRRL